MIINEDSVILENIRPNLHSINITDGTLDNKSEIGIMNVDTFEIRCNDSKLINDGKITIAETGGESIIHNANRSAIYLENDSEPITSNVNDISKSGFGITLQS